MFRQLGPTELIIILVIVLLLFGAKKLPDTARGLGRSMRIFKAETKGLRDDDEPAPAAAPREVESHAAEPRPATPGDPVADSAPSRAPESERTDR